MWEDSITQDASLRSLHADYRCGHDRLVAYFGEEGAEEYACEIYRRRQSLLDPQPFSKEAKFFALVEGHRVDSAYNLLELKASPQRLSLTGHLLRLAFTFPTPEGRMVSALQPLPARIAQARLVTGENGLLVAARIGCEALGEKLLELGSEMKTTNLLGYNTLHIAARHNQPWFITRLARAGLNPNSACLLGRTPLSLAAEHGQEEALKTLLALPGITINQPDKFGLTPLAYALLGDKPACAAQLLRLGAKLDTRDINGASLEQLLRKAKPALSSATEDIFKQAQLNARLLQESGIDPAGQNLLENQANANTLQQQLAALAMADPARVPLLRLLAQKLGHSGPAAHSPEGRVFAAFNRRAFDEVRAIVHHETPDPHARDELGLSLTFKAVLAGQRPLLYFLSSRASAPDTPNLLGETALMAAAQGGDSESVDYLLAMRANPQLTDCAGRSAVSHAQSAGHTKLAHKLEQAAQNWLSNPTP